jgi:hypothetical protein
MFQLSKKTAAGESLDLDIAEPLNNNSQEVGEY